MANPISCVSVNQPHRSSEIRQRWQAINRDRALVEEFIELADLAGKEGSSLLAYDIVHQALKRFPEHLRLRQLGALNLARCGSPQRGAQLLDALIGVSQDEESFGILARCYKDLWERCQEKEKSRVYGERAASLYRKGYEKSGGIYSGINAAAMSLLMGDQTQSRAIAGKLIQVLEEKEVGCPLDYWGLASKAEALLILERVEEAMVAYGRARAHPDASPVHLASTRSQAQRLSDHMKLSFNIAQVLDLPGVVLCAGHMVDHPDRPTPRFPLRCEEGVKRAIEAHLAELNAGVSYSSAACGADLIFVEAMLARGGEVHIVLPFCQEDFIASSVAFAGPQWVDRFVHAIESCHTVHYVTDDGYLGDNTLFSHCNHVMEGLAKIHSKRMGISASAICVWDGTFDGHLGGTASFVSELREGGCEVRVIDPLEVEESPTSEAPFSCFQETGISTTNPLGRQVKGLLFADVSGFSKMTERQYPAFHEHFLSRVHHLTEEYFQRIEFMNTWGDAIHAVFPEVLDCASFALDLRDRIAEVDWSSLGLPADLSLRISLHVGPVYETLDPFLKQKSFFGRQISHAARIEPITTPGCIFASEQVAALISSLQEDMTAEYVGRVPLAKGYGVYPIYQVRRLGDIE